MSAWRSVGYVVLRHGAERVEPRKVCRRVAVPVHGQHSASAAATREGAEQLELTRAQRRCRFALAGDNGELAVGRLDPQCEALRLLQPELQPEREQLEAEPHRGGVVD